MNSDCCYCPGTSYFESRNPELCRSCRRLVPYEKRELKSALALIAPCYDERTGQCPMYAPKTDGDERQADTRLKKHQTQKTT